MVSYLNKRIVVRKKLEDTNTWESENNGIVLYDTFNEKLSLVIGKKRYSFNFDILNSNNKLYEKYFNGDGTTKEFTLEFYPIPSYHLSGKGKKFDVYVNDVLKEYSTDYTVSGSTITFDTAPSNGTRNIRIVYPVVEADDLVDIYFLECLLY